MRSILAFVFLLVVPSISFAETPGVEVLLEVTFDEAIAQALKANPRMALVQAAVARAEAAVVQSRAAWLPALTANATLTELEANRALGDRVLVAQTSLGANLQLSFPLLAVPRWLATGQVKQGVDIANEDKREMARALASLVGRAWLSVRLQERLLQVAKRALVSNEEQLHIAQKRGEGGLGSRLEIVRAHREQSENAGRMARAAAEVKIAREVLAALLAQSQPVGVKGEVVLANIDSTSDVSQVVDSRTDVKAATARVQLADRIRKESWTDYLPTVSLLLQPTTQTPPTPTLPALGFSAQASLQVNLFDGLSRYGVHLERHAQLDAALAQAQEVRLRAQNEIRTALSVLGDRRDAAEAAAASARWAKEAESLAKVSWQEGASTNLELIEAERGARDAETLLEAAKITAQAAQFEALVAAGRWPLPGV